MIVNGVLFVRDMGNQTHYSRSSDRYGGVASDVAIRARQLGFYEKDTQSSFLLTSIKIHDMKINVYRT